MPAALAPAAILYRSATERISQRFFSRLLSSPASIEDVRGRLRYSKPGTLYIHIPYCRCPCRFCSFVRYPYREEQYWRYMRALRLELEELASTVDLDSVSEIYIGGGTPTVNREGFLELIDFLRELLPKARTLSAEANPWSVDDELVEGIRGKVTRLSIGVQSLKGSILERIGRRNHTPEQALRAVKLAAGKVPTVNVDLLFSLPGLDPRSPLEDAMKLAEAGANQVTFYPLMPGLGEHRRSVEEALGRLSFREDYEAYTTIYRGMVSAGWVPRTPWHYAKPGADEVLDEYIVESTDYVAAGLSGIGKAGGMVYANTFDPERYIDRVKRRRLSVSVAVEMSRFEAAIYDLAMYAFGLRVPLEMYGRVPLPVRLLLRVALRREGGHLVPRGLSGLYLIHVGMRSFLSAVSWFRKEALARGV